MAGMNEREIIEDDAAGERVLKNLIGRTIAAIEKDATGNYWRLLLDDGQVFEFGAYGNYEGWAAVYAANVTPAP